MNRKIAHILAYIGFGLVVLLAVWWGVKTQREISLFSIARNDFFPFVQFTTIYSVAVGFLLAIPSIIKEYKKMGSWKVNKSKLLLWSLPLFLMTLYPLLYFYEGDFLNIVFMKSIGLVFYEMNGFLPGALAGYTLGKSFQKQASASF